ncbi:MAG: family 1 glycosylhydrolase [Candidatus Malihini olakiniferum]
MSFKYYFFSISLTRIYPNDAKETPNKASLVHYNAIINTCLAHGIEQTMSCRRIWRPSMADKKPSAS